jgi:hypothetical protein
VWRVQAELRKRCNNEWVFCLSDFAARADRACQRCRLNDQHNINNLSISIFSPNSVHHHTGSKPHPPCPARINATQTWVWTTFLYRRTWLAIQVPRNGVTGGFAHGSAPDETRTEWC